MHVQRSHDPVSVELQDELAKRAYTNVVTSMSRRRHNKLSTRPEFFHSMHSGLAYRRWMTVMCEARGALTANEILHRISKRYYNNYEIGSLAPLYADLRTLLLDAQIISKSGAYYELTEFGKAFAIAFGFVLAENADE